VTLRIPEEFPLETMENQSEIKTASDLKKLKT
jgi:hypothetical protein